MLTEERRTLNLGGRCRQLDRHPNVPPFTTLFIFELDVHLTPANVLVGGQIGRRHDRTAWYVNRIQNCHELALGMVCGELGNQPPHVGLIFASVTNGGKTRVGGKIRQTKIGADPTCQPRPYRFLDHHINPIVRAMWLAVNRVAKLAAA